MLKQALPHTAYDDSKEHLEAKIYQYLQPVLARLEETDGELLEAQRQIVDDSNITPAQRVEAVIRLEGARARTRALSASFMGRPGPRG